MTNQLENNSGAKRLVRLIIFYHLVKSNIIIHFILGKDLYLNKSLCILVDHALKSQYLYWYCPMILVSKSSISIVDINHIDSDMDRSGILKTQSNIVDIYLVGGESVLVGRHEVNNEHDNI